MKKTQFSLGKRKRTHMPRRREDAFFRWLCTDVWDASIMMVMTLSSAPAREWTDAVPGVHVLADEERTERLRRRVSARLGSVAGERLDAEVRMYIRAYTKALAEACLLLRAVRADARKLCLLYDEREARQRRVRKERAAESLSFVKGDDAERLRAYDIFLEETGDEECRMEERRAERVKWLRRKYTRDHAELCLPPARPPHLCADADVRAWVDSELQRLYAECVRIVFR